MVRKKAAKVEGSELSSLNALVINEFDALDTNIEFGVFFNAQIDGKEKNVEVAISIGGE